MLSDLSFYESKTEQYWEEKCTGYDMLEEKGCSVDCKRCKAVPHFRLFVSAFLGSSGHNSGMYDIIVYVKHI